MVYSITFKEDVDWMKEGHNDIDYITGVSVAGVSSPLFLDNLRKEGLEVVYKVDPISFREYVDRQPEETPWWHGRFFWELQGAMFVSVDEFEIVGGDVSRLAEDRSSLKFQATEDLVDALMYSYPVPKVIRFACHRR